MYDFYCVVPLICMYDFCFGKDSVKAIITSWDTVISPLSDCPYNLYSIFFMVRLKPLFSMIFACIVLMGAILLITNIFFSINSETFMFEKKFTIREVRFLKASSKSSIPT